VLYPILRALAWISLRWYYRSIEVVGRERVPATGPVLLAANHNNALVDALIVATSLKRQVRLTAKATLLDHPITRFVVRATGVVPLRRRADVRGDAPGIDRNTEAFRDVVASLAAGGAVLIFPEGISHSGPQLAPLRTGCARMALQAHDAGVEGVHIVPLGLTFERKGSPRTRVLLQVGQSIDVPAVVTGVPDSQRVEAITTRLEEGLRAVTLNFPTHRDALEVLELSRTLGRLFDRLRALHESDTPLAESVQVARRLDEIRQLRPGLDPRVSSRVELFLRRLQVFEDAVADLGLPLNDIWMPTSLASGAWFALREAALTLVLGPLALWGRLNHWIPLRGALAVGRMTSRNPDEPAMRTIVLGVVFVMATYMLTAIAVGAMAGWGWALVYLLSLPIAATVDFLMSDRWERARQRARGYLRFRNAPSLQRELIEDAAWLRAEADSLNRLLE
jgi:1-acyl-sn-glycerol-3-phosphate acyltransferase